MTDATTKPKQVYRTDIPADVVVLYRLYDASDRLLYIGITGDLAARLAGHAARSTWWPQVHRWRAEQFDRWLDAVAGEARAIRHETPVHNKVVGRRRHIVDDILDKIAAGKYRPGDRIPSTDKLAHQYGCGRFTVRQAIDWLLETGELRSRPGLAVWVAGTDRPNDD